MTAHDLHALIESARYLEVRMKNLANIEPVRLFEIAAAALALLVYFVPSIPVALVLGLVAAILGVGENVRSKVTPTAKGTSRPLP